MKVDGYMIEADWDGAVLRVHAKTKAAGIALAGRDHRDDVVVPRDAIADVAWRGANPMVNGRITVTTAQGPRYVLHFRRKQQAGMQELYDALRA